MLQEPIVLSRYLPLVSTHVALILVLKAQRNIALVLLCLLSLTACKTLDTIGGANTPQVGPSVGPPVVQEVAKRPTLNNSNIFLDVVIPVFDPGLPLDDRGDVDYKRVQNDGIWPQLRRAEANRFAVETKRAIENLRAFGAVSVVPSATASGDVYVLGKIEESDSETIKLNIEVVDSKGKSWGKEQFSHQVSPGFFRDKTNQGKDPYEPIFNHIADYVYRLLQNKSEDEKQTIKTITDLRYAQLYSPEVFQQHLKLNKTWRGNYEYELVSLPSENDAMMKRIRPLRVQDQLFIDRLQTQYEGFNAKSDVSYRTWQKETLPEVVALNKARAERNTKVGIGIGLATLAILLDKNSNSTSGSIGTAVGLLASGYFISGALDKSAELKVHKQSLDEMGESLDIEISPQLMSHNEQTVELTGTANEQYTQWKNHLKAIYELEKTPDTKL
jgi:hypothetical protein